MTHVDTQAECLERAKMHDQLAATTDDAPARLMHQAMAAEFRRRAAELRTMNMPPPISEPRLEMYMASK